MTYKIAQQTESMSTFRNLVWHEFEIITRMPSPRFKSYNVHIYSGQFRLYFRSIPCKAGAIYKLLPLHPLQSRSYLHCEGHSNLGLICVRIYSGQFRLYFRSIRPTTTQTLLQPPQLSQLVSLRLGHRSLARPFSPSTLHHGIIAKNSVVLFNYYK